MPRELILIYKSYRYGYLLSVTAVVVVTKSQPVRETDTKTSYAYIMSTRRTGASVKVLNLR